MQFDQLKRREFISLLGRAAAWSLAAYAQQTKVHRVGVLLVGNEDAGSFRTELREELRKSGYIEGQNLFFEVRSAEQKLDLLPRLAGELVALKVDVIVAVYTPCALAAKQATREIPIVVMSGDPVGTGLVNSLSRPGGNITGVSLMAAELKRFQRVSDHWALAGSMSAARVLHCRLWGPSATDFCIHGHVVHHTADRLGGACYPRPVGRRVGACYPQPPV